MSQIAFRVEVKSGDEALVREIVTSTGFFNEAEIEVAAELVAERLARGERSGYHFVFAEVGGRTVGYASFGPIACTVGSFDLFWIAVHADCRGQGIGKALLQEAEAVMQRMGCRNVYIETSSRDQYLPTREFYLRCGYRIEAVLKDFYAPGDDKVIFVRTLVVK